MTFEEAVAGLVTVLQEIEASGISVTTEDYDQIFLLRGRGQEQEFAHLSDHTGVWEAR